MLLILCLFRVRVRVWSHVSGFSTHPVHRTCTRRGRRRGTCIHSGEGGYDGVSWALFEHEADTVEGLRLND
jgi:hypothetical protein